MKNKVHPLRIVREAHNLTREQLAREVGIGSATIKRAERGIPINADSRRRLCDFFQLTSEELGLIPRRTLSPLAFVKEQGITNPDLLQSVARDMQAAIQNLENEGIDMKHSRRTFFQLFAKITLIGASGGTPHFQFSTSTDKRGQILNISQSTIENLAAITQQYRVLQRAGLSTEHILRDHITLIQSTLENTVNDKHRRELWRIQAQSQLLARHSITRKQDLGRARTWNESAIASAQYSGDALLLAAALGHLGHLYLIWLDDVVSARLLLEQAQEYAQGQPISGWFAMISAAIAAREGKRDKCTATIEHATTIVYNMPKTAEYTDLYYTDFNIAGVDALAGNCLLKVGEPERALERLVSLNLDALSGNRHASAFYDISSAYTILGDLDAAQAYAVKSIDKALATDRLYIIPRLITLAHGIQEKDPHESHAASIIEYAHTSLQQHKGVVL